MFSYQSNSDNETIGSSVVAHEYNAGEYYGIGWVEIVDCTRVAVRAKWGHGVYRYPCLRIISYRWL